MTKRGELYIIGGLVSSTLVSGLILSSSAATAETYTKSALIRVQAACTMDGTVTTAHSATIAGGTYREGIGESIVSVACNDAGGFGVYAIGFTGDTDGNNVLAHGTEDVSIATGTATSGNTSNWAMKLEAYENGNNTPTIENGYDSYKVVPSDYTLVASYPNATSATDDVIFRTYYSAYIAMTQRAGTYTGKVKYVMVHPATGPAPEKKCPDFECAGANEPDYPGPSGSQRYRAMQSIATICPKIKTPDFGSMTFPTTTLIDLRDNKLYSVAKLPDGHCWMLDDLALDLTDSSVQTAMTTHDWTNASQTSLGYLFNGGASMESKYASEAVAEFPATWSNNSFHKPLIGKQVLGTFPSNDPIESSSWKAGMFYNACAATAGAFCYSDENGGAGSPVEMHDFNEGPDPDAIDIVEDICPSGWRLPTSGYYYDSGSSYLGLTEHMNEFHYYNFGYSPADYRKVLRLSLPGYYGYGELYSSGTIQSLWSSSAGFVWVYNHIPADEYNSAADDAWYSRYSSYDRYEGISIRCIAKY